jgi:2-dehydro-3-deoxyphosphogluconate aldolase / (4S)-4-hydroxy-2-oxoglutarate aldolase
MMALMAAMSPVERIRTERAIAILHRVPEPDRVVGELVAGGIRIVEITLDSDDALGAIERLRARDDTTVLAGTVRTAADVDRAVAAGAQACVGPAFVPAMVARCVERRVAAIPGALTPSEVEAAWQAGAALVKHFPGSAVGPSYVRALRAPLADVPLLVTGGVTADNARAFLDAGAVAVGVCSHARRGARARAGGADRLSCRRARRATQNAVDASSHSWHACVADTWPLPD